jgi:hypothetical protein
VLGDVDVVVCAPAVQHQLNVTAETLKQNSWNFMDSPFGVACALTARVFGWLH